MIKETQGFLLLSISLFLMICLPSLWDCILLRLREKNISEIIQRHKDMVCAAFLIGSVNHVSVIRKG